MDLEKMKDFVYDSKAGGGIIIYVVYVNALLFCR